jgi:hypothetical protein
VPNRHVELAVQAAATGKAVTNAAVAITMTASSGRVVQRVPVLLLERIAKGSDLWRFGNNVALPAGRYRILVRVGRTMSSFDVVLGR